MTDQDSSPDIQQDPDLLAVEETDGYRLTLRLAKEQMECVAAIELKIPPPAAPQQDLPQSESHHDNLELPEHENVDSVKDGTSTVAEPSNGGISLKTSQLIHLLRQHQVSGDIDEEAVKDFCATIDLQREPPPTVVARGIDPQPGADGWFELLVKISGEDQEFIPDSKGRVDLKRLNAFTEIEPEQKLGVIHPPEPGISGYTVHGHEIEGPAGSPRMMNAGEGVVFKYGGRMAFSTRAGRALFDNNTLTVVDQLIIPGNVDLNVGHVDFNGFVEIKGDVLDDFDVRSTRGIKIGGHVGACHIESEGSIEVGAMAGREIGHIFCQGNLHARFLNQVTVVCYGDVIVTNEIRNSHVRATGYVVVERGGIIGGEVLALKGVAAATIGAVSGQKTRITAGVYFPDVERSEYISRQLNVIEEQIRSINGAIRPLMQHLRKGSQFIDAARARLQILNDKLDALYQQKSAFAAEVNTSQPLKIEDKNPKINIQKILRDGVVIALGRVKEEIKIDRQGPMSIIENTRDGGLRFLALTALPVTAAEIEQEHLGLEENNND